MSLYPDLTEPLREKLEKFEVFREFPGGDELFKKINTQLKKFQEGEVTVAFSATEQDIDNFINNIPLLAKAEIHDLACFIALIEASFLDEKKKQDLSSKLIIKKNKLIRASEEGNFLASDINYLSTLFSNKSSRFMLTIKEILDKFEVEEQYQAFRQFLLEEFNKIGNANTIAYASMRGFISYITYFYQSHASFKRLLQDVNFHVEQYERINKIKLDSDKINLIKNELDSLREVLSEKIANFDPQSEDAQNFWNKMSELFKEFYEKKSELKEANRFALKEVLKNLKHKLAQVTKVPANTFASILVRQDSLIEEMGKLNEEIEAASDVDQFNKSYEQYLALRSDISSLATLSSMKYSFDTFFTRNQQRLNKINSYQIKLQALKGNGSASEEGRLKGRVLAFIKQKSDDIKATEKNNTDPLVLSEKIENLVQYVDKFISQLAQHRNTALKSAFWGLFGIFRPETTSMKLVKDIKEELTQFNTILNSIREAPSCNG